MNHCGIQQSGNFSSFGNGEPVVCPKPRRLNLFNNAINEPARALRWQMCYQQEAYESNAGPELFDLILAKGGGYDVSGTPEQTSSPFFCGSPPSRVSNPLIQDARFGDDSCKISPISPRSMIPNRDSGIPSSSPATGGYLRPMVRIEGFNCLDGGNRRNCSIPALA
ncbi:hypothetical protein R6Q59_030201 [Mikania micrantha]|uniref:Uncharacterized protein n=1 Tax=Mikania micrantha TaxID=192012 RepID=A0A5N6LRZ1_9ASTR|nr:hypothetical protein E3N88_37657 [Mikania micrantha]